MSSADHPKHYGGPDNPYVRDYRAPMSRDILALHDENPHWSSGVLAEKIGCTSGYVRVLLKRYGRQLLTDRSRMARLPPRRRKVT